MMIPSKRKRLQRYLTSGQLRAIAEEIGKQELLTSGEIRVCIKLKRRFWERKKSVESLATREFYRLGMDKTRDKNGTMLFILFDDKEFYVLGDEGVHAKVTDEHWKSVAGVLTAHFKEGRYLDGILESVKMIGKELQAHFPYKSDDANELSNTVEIR